MENRHGAPEFYKLLEEMADTHDKKSHDYASDSNPFANYHFAGEMSKLFQNPHDAGFMGRLAEKLYRLANLENSGKVAKNESIEDTERDVAVIITLWMASRRAERIKTEFKIEHDSACFFCGKGFKSNENKIRTSAVPGRVAHAYCWDNADAPSRFHLKD